MKDSLFQDLLESIKSLPTNILKEIEANMKEEQMRKEFEQWCLEHKMSTTKKYSFSQYIDQFTRMAWTAWKASREHLVVCLPSKSFYNSYEVSYYKHDVEESLTYQGIKWK